MSEPYLIAHVVRGEPAFDIAEKAMIGNEEGWIIPTSGHRARPYWNIPLGDIVFSPENNVALYIGMESIPPCPKDWPDHYACNNSSPKPAPKGNLDLEELGLI